MRTPAAILLLFAIGQSIAQASDSTTIFQQLNGLWQSDGQAFGQTARSTMKWQSTLDGRYFRVNYNISFGPADAPSGSFTGVGYYRLDSESETVSGFWADNTGDLHPIDAAVGDGRLLSTWGIEGSKLGRTAYKILEDGKVQVTDWIWRDGDFRQFNQNAFGKSEE